MKALRHIFLGILLFGGISVFAQEKTDTFKVYGNCGMCKSRVEKTAKVEGVSAATWDKDTKMMTITYNPAKVSLETIQKRIAEVGHDTDLFSASNKVYDKLPGCCHYERKADTKKTD